jgi:ribosome modulation factor
MSNIILHKKRKQQLPSSIWTSDDLREIEKDGLYAGTQGIPYNNPYKKTQSREYITWENGWRKGVEEQNLIEKKLNIED